jgi:hypothetical protein
MGQFWPSSLMGTSSMDVSSTWAQQRNMAGELGWAKGLAVRRLGKAALWEFAEPKIVFRQGKRSCQAR